jgi:ribosomal protein L34E
MSNPINHPGGRHFDAPTKLNLKPTIGMCVNCGRALDSRIKRGPRSTIYVIGSKLCCSKRCVTRAFGAKVAATV